jgi:hypothetical protein
MAVTVITVEEQMRGWLAEINRQREPHRQIAPYAKRWIDSMILNQIKAARKS